MVGKSPDIMEIVGQLHEGVVDDDAWDRGFGNICAMLDIGFVLMGTVGDAGKAVQLSFGYNSRSDAVSLLEGPLADPAHNPWLALADSYPLRRPATVDDVGGREQLQSTRIWQDFYLPYGVGDSIGAALERQPEYASILMLGRRARQPMFRAADVKRVAALLPHVARAWRVKRALNEMQGLVGTLRFVLDRLERAVVVTGPTGTIRFANRAADRLLSRGDGIDVRHGRLRAARPAHTDALASLIGRAADTAIGAQAVAVDALAIPSAKDNPALAIIAEPLAAAHSDALGHAAAPGAILFISDSEASNRPSADRLRVVYGLTPAEAQLTALIVDGHGIAAAAAALGISPNTAKFHLKTIFGKIGISRQAQLVRRVLADVGGLAEPAKLQPSAEP